MSSPRILAVCCVVATSCVACRKSEGPPPAGSLEVVVDPITTRLLIQGDLEQGQLALTFDDGPDPEHTLPLLDILDDHGVKATFFQIGLHAQAHPELTREILARGHALGSHSWDHTDLTELPLPEAVANLEQGHAAVESAAGAGSYLPFFRFPFFASNEDLMTAAAQRGLAVFQANIITEDWLTPDAAELLTNAVDAVEAEGSGIVLFHEYQPQTVEMLDAFLTEIRERGYDTVVFRPRETLASLARSRGIRVGSFVWSLDEIPGSGHRETALREFNIYTLPAFFRIVQPVQGQFDFSIPDQAADQALLTAAFRVHCPLHCDLLADWIVDGGFTGPELEQILVDFVTTVVGHYETAYPGRIASYDIVNEVLSFRGDSCPWNRIGLEAGVDELEYVRIALETARSVSPMAKLYINDFHIEGLNDKSDELYELASGLVADGVPLDGIGLQSHFVVDSEELFGPMPPVDDILQNMERLGALGLETKITEADFSVWTEDLSPELLEHQADSYRDLMHACLASSSCVAFLTWGVGDVDSWILDFFDGWSTPLLFDVDYEPKPAYYALMDELRDTP
ncbi:MAG: endo-1,4-beta-xylanase [bacterium]